MYTHSYSFNTDICLHIHSAECTVRLLNQAKDTLVTIIISYFNKNRVNSNIYIELIEVYTIQITVKIK